jgi:threonine/homoserine/homoserine lactone efflux protein
MNLIKIHLIQADDRQTRWSLLLGVIVWFLDLNFVYSLPSLACEWGWFPFTILGIPGLIFVEMIITVIFMLVMLYLIYLPWRNWRKFQTEKRVDNSHLLSDTEKDRRPMLAFIAMALNSFFFLFVIAFFVPMISLNACVRG